MTNKKHYRLYVINKLPQLRVLDFQKVKLKVCERVVCRLISNMNGCELLYIVYKSSNLGDLFENTKALWCLSIAPVVLASLWVKPPSVFQSFFFKH